MIEMHHKLTVKDDGISACISNANDFYEIACDIDSKRFPLQYKYLSVFATNLTFACELYFKAILLEEKGKLITGHGLTALFSQLTNETQNALEAEFSKGKYLRDLSETLKNCNNIFVDFRYLHQNNKNKEIHTTDLGNLARTLRVICKNDFGFNIE